MVHKPKRDLEEHATTSRREQYLPSSGTGRDDVSANTYSQKIELLGLDPVLRCNAVVEVTGLSRATVFNLMKKGGPYEDETFPRPVKLSKNPKSRAVGWRSSLIIAWLNSRD